MSQTRSRLAALACAALASAAVLVPTLAGPATAADAVTQVTSVPAGSALARSVYIETRLSGGGIQSCSGFMVGPHTVATAGHCLRGESSNQRPVSILAVPGQYITAAGARVRPFGTCSGGYWNAPMASTKAVDPNDYGYFQMTKCVTASGQSASRDVGRRTGYWALSTTTATALSRLPVGYAGYPTMRDRGTGRDGALYRLSAFGSARGDGTFQVAPVVNHGGSGGVLFATLPGQKLQTAVGVEVACNMNLLRHCSGTSVYLPLNAKMVGLLRQGISS